MVAPLAVAVAVKGLGVVLAALAAGGALALPSARARAVSALLALALAPLLLASELWDSPQLVSLRDRPLVAGAGAVAGVALVCALAAFLHRRPWLLPVLAVAALPFRVPFESGGQSANLLLPLYVLVGAGVIAFAWEQLRRGGNSEGWHEREAGWNELEQIVFVELYGIHAVYSGDF